MLTFTPIDFAVAWDPANREFASFPKTVPGQTVGGLVIFKRWGVDEDELFEWNVSHHAGRAMFLCISERVAKAVVESLLAGGLDWTFTEVAELDTDTRKKLRDARNEVLDTVHGAVSSQRRA